MGDVVRMTDWKNRKAKPGPLGRGKTYKYDLDKKHLSQTEVIEQIGILLAKSIEYEQSVPYLPSVHDREQAVIRGMELREEANRYAQLNGLKIERSKDDNGISYFNIFEVTK